MTGNDVVTVKKNNCVPSPYYDGFAALCLAPILLVAALLVTPTSVAAACDKDPECDDVSAWVPFTRITLRQSVSGSPESVEWAGLFDHSTLDVSIDMATHGTKEPMTGTVAVVGGQVMLTKGLNLHPGYEIDALDAPVLSMRLVMIVLNRVFPKGPDGIVGTQKIDRTDKVGIKYATQSASGYIAAPWHVTGKVSKLANGSVSYDIALSFPAQQQDNPNNKMTVYMKGEFSVLGHSVFSDTDSLDGWTTYGLGPQQTKQGSSTILDYGAKPQEAADYRTIGDIRQFIAAENHPGSKDDSMDFTGFWKEKCDQAFGLQIMHQGTEGKYSVVFCGPGGCGEPSDSTLTFITGDKHWEVVSEDKLIEIGRDGSRQTYHRCTKDTHPVLRYRE